MNEVNFNQLQIDFNSSEYTKIAQIASKSSLLAKSFNFKKKNNIKILDATAGFLKDAIYVSCLGAQVIALEKNANLYDKLNQAMQSIETSNPILNALQTIQLIHQSSIKYIEQTQEAFDAIYFDPMFTEGHRKKRKSNKNMELLKNFEQNEQNFDSIYEKSITIANKLIVKRHKHSYELFQGKKVSYQLLGKSIRYDIYISPHWIAI